MSEDVFHDKVTIITGASAGAGHERARHLAIEDATLFLAPGIPPAGCGAKSIAVESTVLPGGSSGAHGNANYIQAKPRREKR